MNILNHVGVIMSSGSGTSAVLGASTTIAGVAMLPVTGGENWVLGTALAITAGGLTLLGFRAYAAIVERRG